VSQEQGAKKARLVSRELTIPFVLLVLCFAAWGAAANLTDIPGRVFPVHLRHVELPVVAGPVRLLRAYFLLAIPGCLYQQALRVQGGSAQRARARSGRWPPVHPGEPAVGLRGLPDRAVRAGRGLSILETSANPFVIAMGSEASATQRLNLAQAFNPVGANIGVLLGAIFILPELTSEAAKTIMSPEELRQSQEQDLSLVLGPYLGIAAVLVLIWLLIAFRKMDVPAEEVRLPFSRGTSPAGCGPTATTALG
jgi:FHS family L-fucose permease-like MFS transporter